MAYKGIGILKRPAELAAAGNVQPSYQYRGYRYGRYGWYGEYAYGSNRYGEQRARTEARTKVRAEGAKAALDIMQRIYNEESKVRNTVVDKYNIDL